MKEREYCFKVNDLEKSKQFCVDNGFCLESNTEQTRTIYRRSDKTMARITEDKCDNKIKLSLDFKEDKLSASVLIVRKESMPLEFENIDAVLSILDFLDYHKDNVLKRKRWIYIKEKIKCEIDLYDSVEKTIVVSIEGDDFNGVDDFYNKFIQHLGKYAK